MKATIVVLVAFWLSVRLIRSDDPLVVTIVFVLMFDLYAVLVTLVELAPEEPSNGSDETPP